ncbi:MAG: hypothetical protein K2X73_13530 [Sphingomonas sp.]|jgi:hypothetical protein|nr:hypothetical protein [Sphingomonas sp.]
MRFFARFSPIAALADLRAFFAARKRHELWFFACSAALTAGIILALIKDASEFKRPYTPNIIYVEQWPASRTDDEIRAQQKIDQAKKHAELARIEALKKKRQASFKKVDDALKQWGI